MKDKITEQVERIVEEGEDIQQKVSDVVAEATHEVEETSNRLVELTRAAMDGAVTALDRTKPQDPESTLRKVVEGIGEGVSRSAQAATLAIKEAAGDGRTYAKEDMRRLSDDLKALTNMFADVVEHQSKQAYGHTKEQLASLRDHAERTIQAIRPSIASALDAAAHDPVGLAGESAKTAVKFTREAAGMLFSKIGEVLQTEKGDSGPK